MRRKAISIILWLFTAFCLSIVLDRSVGIILNKIGYFKAMMPNVTKIFDTNEFNVVAKISSQGLNNEEVKIPKPKDTFRILTVGDSFTFGWGVELKKNWVKLLEKSLKVKGKKVEVIDAGVPGAGFKEETQICEAYKSRFNPDAIIIGTFADDLVQTVNRQEFRYSLSNLPNIVWPTLTRIRNPIIYDIIWRNVKGGMTLRLSQEWKRQVASAMKQTPMLLLNIIPEIRSGWLHGKVFPELALNLWQNPDFLANYVNPYRFNYALSVMSQRLDALKRNCSGNLPVFELFIPDVVFVGKSPDVPANSPEQVMVNLDIDGLMKKTIEKKGFVYISPLENFRKDGCPDCYYKYDHHFTEKGNIRFAQYVGPIIQKYLDKIKI